MRWKLVRSAPLWAGIAALSCAQEFDTQRVPLPIGTVGEEVFRIMCERMNFEENPSDISFANARRACTQGLGETDSVVGVRPRVTAVARMRTAVVASLDQSIPRALYTPMDALLINLLPMYGPDGTGRSVIALPDGGTAGIENFPADWRPSALCNQNPDAAGCLVGMLPQTTRSVAGMLEIMANDAAALRAMSRISQHQGYRPNRTAIGLLRPVLAYPRIDPLLDNTLRLVRDPIPANATRAAVPAGTANGHFNTLLSTLRGEFSVAAPATPAEARGGTTLDVATDLLFRSDPDLGVSQPIDLVRRDFRGMPSVATTSSGGLPAPFVDANRDGLADATAGVFVNGTQRLNTPTPFATRFSGMASRDASGRASAPGGGTLYNYLDLNPTVLAAVARQLPALMGGPDHRIIPALDLLHGSSALFGARRMATKDYGPPVGALRYSQFSAENAPLVDLVHAAGQLLGHRDIDPILTTTRALVGADREAVTARLVGDIFAINDIANRHPEATIAPTSNIWDDVMDVVKDIAAEPGLLEDILNAMAQSGDTVARLGPAFSAYAQYRERVEPDWTATGMPLRASTLSSPVNRSSPDTRDNRSALQRLFHLVDDLNGAPLCSKAGARVRVQGIPLVGGVTLATANNECEIFSVPDAAAFYVRAIDGRGQIDMHIPGLSGLLLDGVRRLFPSLGGSLDSLMDALIEQQSGIPGFDASPTPQAINRMVFRPDPPACASGNDFLCNLLDPARSRTGRVVRDDHPGTIFVWEMYGFYDAVRPLAHAFVMHDRETCKPGDPRRAGQNLCSETRNITNFDPARGSRLFVRLLSAMHQHWATDRAGDYQSTNPRGPLYSTGDGAMRYEPIIAEALSGDMLAGLSAASAALRDIDAGNGVRGHQAIASLVRGLVDPDTLPVSYRNGMTSTVRSDGRTPVPRASLFYLFADGFNAIDTAFASDRPRLDAWRRARSASVDQFLTVTGMGAGSRWQNRTIPPLTRLMVQWAQERVAAHRTQADLLAWSRSLGPRLATVVQGPMFAAGVDLTLDLNADAAAREQTALLLEYLLNERGDTPRVASPFAVTMTAAADLVQIARDDDDLDPLLHAVAPAFTPQTGAAARGLQFLDRARTYDPQRVLTQVLGNMVQAPPAGDALTPEPLVVIADAIADAQRREPGNHGPLSAEDMRDVLYAVIDFLTDHSRGLEEFYYIVQHRRLP